MFAACSGDEMVLGVGRGSGLQRASALQTGILCLCENSDSPQGRFVLESLKEVSEPSVWRASPTLVISLATSIPLCIPGSLRGPKETCRPLSSASVRRADVFGEWGLAGGGTGD